MYENNWEKSIPSYTAMAMEQLKTLTMSFYELTSYQWPERFDSWPASTLQIQLNGLLVSGGVLATE